MVWAQNFTVWVLLNAWFFLSIEKKNSGVTFFTRFTTMAKVHRIAVRASTTDEAKYRAVSYTKSGGEVKEWVREIDVAFRKC